jgi:hypothetical protein
VDVWTLEEDWIEQCIGDDDGHVLAVLLLFPVNEEREEVI